MTTTTNKGYTLPAVGADFGVWGSELNADLSIIDLNFAGVTNVNVAGNTNVTASGAQMQNIVQQLSGVLTGNIRYLIPKQGFWIVQNLTSGAFTITVACSGGGTGVVVAQGINLLLWSDGTTFYEQSIVGPSATISGNATIGGTLAVTGNTTVGGNETVTGTVTATDPNAQGGVIVNHTGSTAAAVKLAGPGATTPNKWIRANAGTFSVVNNGYTTEILSLTDAGALNVTGTATASGFSTAGQVTATGNITTSASLVSHYFENLGAQDSFGYIYAHSSNIFADGNVESVGGHVYAALGYNAGELHYCVNGNDFGRFSNGSSFYQLFPTGTLIQGGTSATDTFVGFPTAFPNALSSVVVSVNGGSGPALGILVIGNQGAGGFSCWGAVPGFNGANIIIQSAVLGFNWMAIGY